MSCVRSLLALTACFRGRDGLRQAPVNPRHLFVESPAFANVHLGQRELSDLEPALNIGEGVGFFDSDWAHVTDPGGLTGHIAADAIEQGARWLNQRVRSIKMDSPGLFLVLDDGEELQAKMAEFDSVQSLCGDLEGGCSLSEGQNES